MPVFPIFTYLKSTQNICQFYRIFLLQIRSFSKLIQHFLLTLNAFPYISDVNVSLQNLQQRVNLLERSLAPYTLPPPPPPPHPPSMSFGTSHNFHTNNIPTTVVNTTTYGKFANCKMMTNRTVPCVSRLFRLNLVKRSEMFLKGHF